MAALLDDTILALAERVFEIIKVVQVGVADSLLDLLNPIVPLFFDVKVVNTPLVREDEHERVQNSAVFHLLLSLTLDIDTCK